MSGFQSLVSQATLLLGIAALIGVVIGWSFGALRASRLTTESYERQLRATLRRMSDAEAETVTLRGRLEEYEAVLASQEREYESREHLLAALEARLAEAEGAAADAIRAEHAAAMQTAGAEPAEPDVDTGPSADPDAVTPDLDEIVETELVGDAIDDAFEELAAEEAAAGESEEESAEPEPADLGPESEDLLEPATSALQNGEPQLELEPAPDDLTAIKGIGKVIAGTLEEHGITTYEQIAAWTDADIEDIEARIEVLRGRVRRDDWIGSAAALYEAHHSAAV